MSENNDLPLDGRRGNLYDPMFTDRITRLDGRGGRPRPEGGPPWVGLLVGFLVIGVLHCFVTYEPRGPAPPGPAEVALPEDAEPVLPLPRPDSLRSVSVVCHVAAHPADGKVRAGPSGPGDR